MTADNKENGSSHVRDRFKMDPPENAWSLLDAELARKQAIINRQRGNRFKMLSIGLALLLILSLTYYYISFNQQKALVNPAVRNTAASVNAGKGAAISNKIAPHDNSKVNNHFSKDPVLKRGLGTGSNHATAVVSGSSSLFNKHWSRTYKGSSTGKQEDSKPLNDEGQNSAGNDENKIGGINERNNRAEKPAIASDINDRETSEGKPSEASSDHNSKELPSETNNTDQTLLAADSGKNNAIKDSLLNKVKNHASRWSVAASYAPDIYTGNQLVDNGNGYGNNNAENYNGIEKSNYSFALGLTLRYNLTPHWMLSAGATYSTIAYSTTLTTLYAGYGSNDQLQYMYPTACGNVEIPNAPNTMLQAGDSLNTWAACTQVVKLLNVPLAVRYQLTKNRFTFYANTGVSINFVLQEQASMVIGNAETTIVNNIQGLQKINFGYLFGAGIEYKLYNNTGIFIEPCFTGSITSLTQNTAPYYCYPYAFRMNTGVSFHF